MMATRNRSQRAPTTVVDAHRWLAGRVEALVDAGDYGEAVAAVNRLLSVARDGSTRLFCYENLGLLAYRAGDVDRASRAFEQASALSDESADRQPGLAYALGNCAAARARWWPALMHYFRAIHHAKDPRDTAEFMRAAGAAMSRLGFSKRALSIFLGALDRWPDNPWILASVSSFYESQKRWVDALEVQQALIDVLADGLPKPASTSHPSAAEIDHLISRFMAMWTIDADDIARRVRAITDRLRAQIGIARDAPVDRHRGDHGLMSLNLPAGLHLLVDQLARHERNFLLLSTAQSLWAKSRHDRFDVHLRPYLLAAAIQVVSERRHWRIPTPLDELAEIYGVDADTVAAAARLIAGRYHIEWLPARDVQAGLDFAQSQQLLQIQRALMYGVDVRELRAQRAMLAE